MKKFRYFILLPALLMATTAVAERVFKWVDSEGQVHYGNRVPPEYANKERKEINELGRTVKIYEAAMTPDEKMAAQKAAELEARKKALDEKRAIHDRSLLATYASEQDMLLARDGKIASIEALLQLTSSRIESMKQRLHGLTEEAATYERSGKPLPHTVEAQIDNLRSQITRNEGFIREKEQELGDINIQFTDDISRFIELTAEQDDPETTAQRIANLKESKNKLNVDLTLHDRTLLTSYKGEEDIVLARDQKLATINELITLTSERIQSLQDHLADLSDQAVEYESRDQKRPEVLLGQMKNVQESIAQNEELLALKRQEKTSIEQQYMEDILRYRQLTASN
jgi:DNA repair exonuclease SbcCD ATPase subunit